MKINQTGLFKKAYKKLYAAQLQAVNAAITKIIANPYIGEQKKGDLNWLWVYKFKAQNQFMLLGYCIDQASGNITLTLIALGSHENFYRNIKR